MFISVTLVFNSLKNRYHLSQHQHIYNHYHHHHHHHPVEAADDLVEDHQGLHSSLQPTQFTQ
jgi:hypothetical protein